MRRIISLLLLSFVIFQFVHAEDKIKDPNEWDFGKVKQGEVLKHDFVFRNMTADTVNITGINTSCGCTASESGKKSLKPGESTMINVSFNSKGYVGQVSQFVYVNTDNANLAVTKFVIKADIVKEGD